MSPAPLPVQVRRARPDEYARVGALTVAAYKALPVDHLWGGYEEAILDTSTRAEHGVILAAVTADDTVVGAVTYASEQGSEWNEWTEPGEAQFRLLAVDPGARQRGAATSLVVACTELAADEGLSLLIHTTQWMEAAQRLYPRLGFVRRPDRDVPYEHWLDEGVPNLPPEWVGQPFLAYSWPGPA